MCPSRRAAVARSTVEPHIHVTHVTHVPQRPYTGGPSSRRTLRVSAFIRLGYKPKVIVLTGSKFKDCPPIPTYQTASGGTHSRMGSAEYVAALTRVLRSTGPAAQRSTRSSRGTVLWHDHDPSHKANDTKQWLEEQHIQCVQTPVRSPDLSPLDYGVFGVAKRRWRRAVQREGLGWDDACKSFIRELESMDTDNIIKQLPLRLEACLEAKGGHIEDMLSLLQQAGRHTR